AYGPNYNSGDEDVCAGSGSTRLGGVCREDVSKRDYLRKGNKYLPKIAEYIKERGGNEPVIPLSCEFELELLDLEAAGQLETYFKENPTNKLIKDCVSRMGYQPLGLTSCFTADMLRSCTDFEKGFIMADVQAFADLKELGSEEAVKKAGKLKQQGKKYEVQDGDIIFFKFNN
ncbi:Obg-like ATPase 1, variant, partial [Phytophthora palmivora]